MSTGHYYFRTKQFIFTALPLYILEPNNAVILIDEPETSLYPDIQQQIVKTYTSFGTNCQFFFATHSPIIASSFEPWEIVELEFDNEGFVQRKLYYKGENHVNNYTIDPRYLRWDSLLQKMFDVEGDGNSKYRIPKMMEIATLESQLKQMKNNGATKTEIKEKWETYKRVGQLLDWELERA